MARRRSLKGHRPVGNSVCRYEHLSYNEDTNHWENVSSGSVTGSMTSTLTSWPTFPNDVTEVCTVAGNSELNALTTYSTESWVKFSGFGGSFQVVAASKHPHLATVWVNTSGFLGWFSLNGGNVSTTTQFSTGSWHHVALTVTSASSATIYVDGVTVKTGLYGAGATTTAAVMVGSIGFWPLQGDQDVVRIYDRALSSDEVLRNYHAGMARHQ